MREIHSAHAPNAIGAYSQAIRCGDTVYLSGQIPLDYRTMELCSGDIESQIEQVFDNLVAVCEAAGGTLANVVKLSVYLIDLNHFSYVNDVMKRRFKEPFPARVTVGVAALPRGAQIEIDGIMVLLSS